jgi:alanyl-tRNA synthetase
MSEKNYDPRMHSAEHILNQTMVQMFGCKRSMNSHIERKKSKCDYILKEQPTTTQITEIENKVNSIIQSNLNVNIEFVAKEAASQFLDLSKLPQDAPETLRVVRIGSYDACACIGPHVSNTSEIGQFQIISTDFSNGVIRIRFKLAGVE